MPAIPFVDYVINYKYISEELCVNRDKPELHCNGKCHLKKEIKSILDTDENPVLPTRKTTLPKKELKEYTSFIIKTETIPYTFLKKLNFKLKPRFFLNQKLRDGFYQKPFKPPQLLI